MATQTTMKQKSDPSLNGMLTDLGDLGGNLTLLATLQARLAAQDLRESAVRAEVAQAGGRRDGGQGLHRDR